MLYDYFCSSYLLIEFVKAELLYRIIDTYRCFAIQKNSCDIKLFFALRKCSGHLYNVLTKFLSKLTNYKSDQPNDN